MAGSLGTELVAACFTLWGRLAPRTQLLCLSADLIVMLLKLESELSIDNFNYFLYVAYPEAETLP